MNKYSIQSCYLHIYLLVCAFWRILIFTLISSSDHVHAYIAINQRVNMCKTINLLFVKEVFIRIKY